MSKKVTTESFIKEAKKIHGDKYDYSKTIYVKAKEKVIITCPKHGDFLQTPNSHLRGNGCPGCKSESTGQRCRSTKEYFISRSKKVHGDKYDYSKVNYIDNKTKVEIICPIHGSFFQFPGNHYRHGCPHCKGNNISKSKTRSKEEFINRAKLVHEDKYDYSKVDYVDSVTPVDIVCKKHNLVFKQSPANHLQGKGCPRCNSSKLEELVRNSLINNDIYFKEQESWDWLIYKKRQYVDFYLPGYNIAIECQGEQHFEEIKYFGGKESLQLTVDRDKNKLNLCNEHNIKLLYISNLGDDYPYPYNVFTNIEDLINEIKKTNLTN